MQKFMMEFEGCLVQVVSDATDDRESRIVVVVVGRREEGKAKEEK